VFTKPLQTGGPYVHTPLPKHPRPPTEAAAGAGAPGRSPVAESHEPLAPADKTTLEVTIGYEQVAVDLTSRVAQNEPDAYLRQVYEFGLLEDFDHLYRYANLYDLLDGKKAEKIVGALTEITLGRPTIFEHVDPRDEIRRPMTNLSDQVELTSKGSVFVPVSGLAPDDRYFAYNGTMNAGWVPTEEVIRETR
jgi:hypothetical protein